MDEQAKTEPTNPGNTKPDYAAKGWVFTYNNYFEENIQAILQWFGEEAEKYFFAREVGKLKGTPHLQGFVSFKSRKYFSSLKKFDPRISWKKRRANHKKNLEYCSKEHNEFWTNMRLPRSLRWPEKWYPWQEAVIELVDAQEYDDRQIWWFWEPNGNVGKTKLTNYLVAVKQCCLVPNKISDAMHALAKRIDNVDPIDVVIFDVPRSSFGYLNYAGIEKIKDGQIVSGKYEGCLAIIASPIVIIFANEEPEYDMMSKDRWNVIRID